MGGTEHMKTLKPFLLVTDLGFIAYWMITLLHLIPNAILFKDYSNPILISWNWSFFPLDMFISATGLLSLYYYNKGNRIWMKFCLISLVLTFCSGLQALAFWVMRADFDWTWWIPNAYLLIYPLFFIIPLLQERYE